MKMRSRWREKYALILLKMRETNRSGTRMNATEIAVAIDGAYLVPTYGLNPLVISLLAFVR